MKFLLIAAVICISQPCLAAGVMRDVSQNVDISGATLITGPASAGGEVSLKYKKIKKKKEKTEGGISIGEIENHGGTMSGVSQSVEASGAEVITKGAGISIGRILSE